MVWPLAPPAVRSRSLVRGRAIFPFICQGKPAELCLFGGVNANAKDRASKASFGEVCTDQHQGRNDEDEGGG